MKKFIATVLACVSVFGAIGMASCSTVKKDELKVFDSILLTEEEYAFAIAKENDELETAVNELIADMKEDGSLQTLIDSYFDGTATFSYTNKTNSPQEGDFIMATNAFFEPYEFYDGDAVVGIDAEMAQSICDKLGYKLVIDDMDFDSIITAVQSGKADFGMAGMTVTEERLESIDFTNPYTTATQVIIVKG